VVTYGHSVLRSRSEPVLKITSEIKQLARDMLRAMYASNGVGLAAEQVGRKESVCVIDVSPAMKDDPALQNIPRQPMILINPEIIKMEGKTRGQEGCLSFPDIFVPVTRALDITVRYMDMNWHEQTLDASGFLARAIQHEVDHLHGILLVDHMSAAQKVVNSGKLRRLKKAAAKEE
jgi:peptide deformylase